MLQIWSEFRPIMLERRWKTSAPTKDESFFEVKERVASEEFENFELNRTLKK
jgi:hypothetical protein